MNCYQILYAATAHSRGFGIRAASSGTPEVLVSYIQQIATYKSGNFNIPNMSKVISETPERIIEFPVTFNYATVDDGDCIWYVLSRIVPTCFDYPFYSSGVVSRSGNFVLHAMCFDEFPGRDAFCMMTDNRNSSMAHFIPICWKPSLDNKELVEIMQGEGNPLPNIFRFTTSERPCSTAIDLLFSYRAAITFDKPIVISLPASQTYAVADFMALLPEKVAAYTTFSINHQEEGHCKDAKITFINEYYNHEIYRSLCTYIDMISITREPDNLEKMWRPTIERALAMGETQLVLNIAEWIFCPEASILAKGSFDLGKSLFQFLFCKLPLAKLSTVDGILLIKAAQAANADPEKYRDYITEFFLASPDNTVATLKEINHDIVRKFTRTEIYPDLHTLLSGFTTLSHNSEISYDDIFMAITFFCGDPAKRVASYVEQLRLHPDDLPLYSFLLEQDSLEAKKIDYIQSFYSQLYNPNFAALFYGQILRKVGTANPFDLAQTICNIGNENNQFAIMLFNGKDLFTDLYESAVEILNNSNKGVALRACNEIQNFLPEDDDFPSKRKWRILKKVINCEEPIKEDAEDYWFLAQKLHSEGAIKAVAPQCFNFLPHGEIKNFIDLCRKHNIMDDKDMLTALQVSHSQCKLEFATEIAMAFNYNYDEIFHTISAYETDERTAVKNIKKNFPKQHIQHLMNNAISTVKRIIDKKEK